VSAIKIIAAVSISLALSCEPGFSSSSIVTGLRVLAIGADRPEIQPGETAKLYVLIADPQGGGRQLTSVWFGCHPEPLNSSPCDLTANLLDLSSFLQQPGTFAIPSPPVYLAPTDSLDGLPDPDKLTGGRDGQIILAAAPGGVDQALRGPGERVAVIARIKVSKAPVPNHNPVATGLTVDGANAPEGSTIEIAAGSAPTFELLVGLEQSEVVPILDPAGPAPCSPQAGCADPALCPSIDCGKNQMCRIDRQPTVCEKHEALSVDWLTTAGVFARTAPGASAPDGGLPDERGDLRVPHHVETVYLAPGGSGRDPIPGDGMVTLWIVLRDDRYGVSWTSRLLHIH
jgi:hypothetical protein